MSILQTSTVVRHRTNRRIRVRRWVADKTTGNFSFGAMVGVIAYMMLTVVYRLVLALFF